MYTSMSCRYADLLGVPGQGFHELRVCGLAALDVVGTVGLAWILHHVSRWSMAVCLVIMVAVGILCHRVFCVRTVVDKVLFG